MAEVRKSFCRNCGAACGIELEIDGSRIVELRGDRQNPISKGYACVKAQASKERQNGLGRLVASQMGRGASHSAISTSEALDQVGARLVGLVSRYGPRSVGLYYGTGAYTSSLALPFAKAWMAAIGSPQVYSSQTIDQSPKNICALRMGAFMSGRQPFATSDVWMISGSNPLVSHFGGWGGTTMYAPATDIAAARKRGLKLIVIDPRRTETARLADIHLQPRPGQDVAVNAAMLNHILSHGLHDEAFCARYVAGLDDLKSLVSTYTIADAASAADVQASDLVAAAVTFAHGPRGCAVSGTGPNMAPHANLAEHLLECLNVVCGRYRRAGDTVLNPSVLTHSPVREGVHPPYPIWDHSPKMASHPEVGWALPNEYPSNLLADEIAHPGEDRLRALVVVGGNPMNAIPDHEAVRHAFGRLELLVSLDVQMNETAVVSDYVICCKTPYERADLALMTDGNSPVAAVQYAEAALQPPPEALEEWEVFYGLGQRMGLDMAWAFSNIGSPPSPEVMRLDMKAKPSTDVLFEFICRHPEVGFGEIRSAAVGQVVKLREQTVSPPETTDGARLDVMPAEVASEFASCRASGQRQDLAADELLLHSRRLMVAMNSNFLDGATVRARAPINPVYMNPLDMAERGLFAGQAVEVATCHGRILTEVRGDATERRGAVSMHHSWGRRFGDDGEERPFAPITVLIDKDDCRENRNFVPRMSAIPVRVTGMKSADPGRSSGTPG